jgi:hypothetical protein
MNMNLGNLNLLEAIRTTLASVPGVRTSRLILGNERIEVPLSRLPAVTIELLDCEVLAWPQVPVGAYSLLRWRATVMDRAVPGTRAFESLVSVAEACRNALAAAPLLGGLAEDGPSTEADRNLTPPVGATRLGPIYLGEVLPGRPTTVAFAGASGKWTAKQTGSATIDGEALFAFGPHVVAAGSPSRRTKDQVFNGLVGGLVLDLGDGPREILQTGVLAASSAFNLAVLEAAIEAFIDGRAYTLIAPDGMGYPNCRVERFERLGPPQIGTKWHQPYRVTYRQLAR